MDFQRFGIDARLLDASFIFRSQAFSHETMLSHVLEKGENVCARIVMSQGREEVCLLPVLQSLAAAPPGGAVKALVVVAAGEMGRSALTFCRAGGERLGLRACLVGLSVAEGGALPSFDGESSADIVIGEPEALLLGAESGAIRLRDFGWLVADGLERLAELPGEPMRRLGSSLLPPWERRSILACEKLTIKAKNLAYDLADNPSEIRIDEEVAKAQSVAMETWRLETEEKPRFLLGLMERERPQRLCVFCNLSSTAEETARRLRAKGLRSEYVPESCASDRAGLVLERVKTGDCLALVLTDEGARNLAGRGFEALFPLIVNFDIPLEPEYFVKRLELLDRSVAAAKVVSMVCDRYVYGLSAVEHYIDAKLDARPVDASLLAAKDLDEEPRADRSEPDRPRGRDGRDGRGASGPRGRDGATGRDDSRGRDRRGPTSRQSRPAAQRDDRSPDIRRSIAEATGGSLDIKSREEKPAVEKGDSRAPRSKAHGSRGVEGKRSRESGGGNAGERGGSKRRPSGREESGNPYALPMEERMKRYREKYGRKVEGPGRGKSGSPQARDKKGAGDRSSGGGGQRNSGERAAQGVRPPTPPSRPERPGSDSPSSSAAPAPSGFFGKIRGAFRKRGGE
ncbi:MAG: hypothetical protein M0Z80_13525 [Treponema sp.]|nr:hypothetical protein [Treponema sp.]